MRLDQLPGERQTQPLPALNRLAVCRQLQAIHYPRQRCRIHTRAIVGNDDAGAVLALDPAARDFDQYPTARRGCGNGIVDKVTNGPSKPAGVA